MDDRKECADHDGEHGHRFGCASYPGSPRRAKEEQHSGDQGARVRDPDPEDEVGDVYGPLDRMLVPGQTETGLAW